MRVGEGPHLHPRPPCCCSRAGPIAAVVCLSACLPACIDAHLPQHARRPPHAHLPPHLLAVGEGGCAAKEATRPAGENMGMGECLGECVCLTYAENICFEICCFVPALPRSVLPFSVCMEWAWAQACMQTYPCVNLCVHSCTACVHMIAAG